VIPRYAIYLRVNAGTLDWDFTVIVNYLDKFPTLLIIDLPIVLKCLVS
jgi:hypothetical protein